MHNIYIPYFVLYILIIHNNVISPPPPSYHRSLWVSLQAPQSRQRIQLPTLSFLNLFILKNNSETSS